LLRLLKNVDLHIISADESAEKNNGFNRSAMQE
jgi:hypothetical protein